MLRRTFGYNMYTFFFSKIYSDKTELKFSKIIKIVVIKPKALKSVFFEKQSPNRIVPKVEIEKENRKTIMMIQKSFLIVLITSTILKNISKSRHLPTSVQLI